MTTEQEDQIAKLNRFIINIQSLQEITVKQVENERGRNPNLNSPYFNIPFPLYLGNGSTVNDMATTLKTAIKDVTDEWISDAKKRIIRIVEAS